MDVKDYLHEKFNRRTDQIPPVRIKKFKRMNLARLFGELGFQRGAEVGVAGGHYSEELCRFISNLELLCVDPWEKYSENPRGQDNQEEMHNRTKKVLAPYKVKLVKAKSMDAVRNVAMESLDFVYIDGHHGFDYVMQDLIEWSKRVKKGGIVSGHDYYRFRWAGVVDAVDAYTRAHQINEWFVCDERESSFFWVKP